MKFKSITVHDISLTAVATNVKTVFLSCYSSAICKLLW